MYEHDPKAAIAHTCVQLRAIALPIYYGQNAFAFKSPNDAVAWLDTRLGKKDKAAVRHVFVEMTPCRKRRRKPEWSRQLLHVVEMVLAEANTLTAIVGSRRRGEWQSLLKENVQKWVKEINNEGLCSRETGDEIAHLCRRLSLFSQPSSQGLERV